MNTAKATPRHNVRKSTTVADALMGLLALGVVAGFIFIAFAVYAKAFTPATEITLTTSAVGNALQKGSDVKLHGVPVGEVRTVNASPNGAEVTLALTPEIARQLPASTTARLLPKTLFGERYVSLITPAVANGSTLATGGTIHQDDSDQAVELEEVFDELLPVLKALKPHKLQATLSELATMLRGQGHEIGDSMEAWSAYLEKLNPSVPTMIDDFEKLAQVAASYDEAMPDLLDALDEMRTTSATFVDRRKDLIDVYASVIASADETESWVDRNQNTIIVLSDHSSEALKTVRPYASQFPCLLSSANQFIDVMDKTLGKDTGKPGIHVNMQITAHRGAYQPRIDAPKFERNGSPRCPYTTGQTGTQKVTATSNSTEPAPATIAAPRLPIAAQQAAAGLGLANSPAENQLIAELYAPGANVAPTDYPGWGSLLVGPALRGTEVSLS